MNWRYNRVLMKARPQSYMWLTVLLSMTGNMSSIIKEVLTGCRAIKLVKMRIYMFNELSFQ